MIPSRQFIRAKTLHAIRRRSQRHRRRRRRRPHGTRHCADRRASRLRGPPHRRQACCRSRGESRRSPTCSRTLVAKGKIDAANADAAAARIALPEALSGLAGCTIVIEAIIERLDAKQALFPPLEAVVGDDCILATNTSSLSVTAIASACTRPERVAGLHFFQPGAADETRRGHRRTADRPAGARAVACLRYRARPYRGAGKGYAGLHRQSRRTRLRHRGAAHRRRRRRRFCRDRPHPQACGGISHGPVRAVRPDRARCLAPGDGIHLPSVLRGTPVPAVAHHGATPVSRRAGAQDGAAAFTTIVAPTTGAAPLPPATARPAGLVWIGHGPPQARSAVIELALAQGARVDEAEDAARRCALHRPAAGPGRDDHRGWRNSSIRLARLRWTRCSASSATAR